MSTRFLTRLPIAHTTKLKPRTVADANVLKGLGASHSKPSLRAKSKILGVTNIKKG